MGWLIRRPHAEPLKNFIKLQIVFINFFYLSLKRIGVKFTDFRSVLLFGPNLFLEALVRPPDTAAERGGGISLSELPYLFAHFYVQAPLFSSRRPRTSLSAGSRRPF